MQSDRFRRVLGTGEVLFREGDLGHEAYVIESGAVEIFLQKPEGRQRLAQLGVDEIFGEMALAGDQTRTASVMATEATVVLVITHEYLSERLNHADPMLRHRLRVTMARCRDSLTLARGEKTLTTVAEVVPGEQTLDDRNVALKRLRIEQSLESALDNNEFQLHYQPIIRLSDSTVAGFEALIRWFRPGVGRIPPNEFIWVAEESGLIIKMGHWIIRTACEAINRMEAVHRIRNPDAPPLFITINLSIRQFSDPDLFTVLEDALKTNWLAARRVKLEITESLVMNNMDAALTLLNRCKAMGCQLAVDDFGTGYSSLSYLHKFPMDTLKLDRAFVKDIATSEPGMKIVRAVSGLANDLGMETVAEGIETAEQADICHKIGIGYAQGFHYSAALPLKEAGIYLQSHGLRARAA